MGKITLEIPEEAMRRSSQSPQDFANELRLAAAIFWYSRGEISQEKGAQIAGLNREEFLLALSREKVEIFQNDADDFGVGGR